MNPGQPVAALMLLATTLCCDSPRSWSIFQLGMGCFFPEETWISFLMNPSGWRVHLSLPHASSPLTLQVTVFTLWGDFLSNISQPHLLTVTCPGAFSASVKVYPTPLWLMRGTFPGNLVDGHVTVMRCSECLNHSCCLATCLCLAGGRWLRHRYTQTQGRYVLGTTAEFMCNLDTVLSRVLLAGAPSILSSQGIQNAGRCAGHQQIPYRRNTGYVIFPAEFWRKTLRPK